MITLHHLRIGRSVFTAWLMEELGVEYEVKRYKRNEMRRAPPELRQVHPLGKSPVIEVDGMVIAESGAIAAYLLTHQAPGSDLEPPSGDTRAWVAWTQWLHYPEGSAFAPLLIQLLMTGDTGPKSAVLEGFARDEIALHLGYMRDQLGDQAFILGDRLQAPDIGVTYVLQLADRLGTMEGFSTLKAYLDRNLARPGFVRAMERTGG